MRGFGAVAPLFVTRFYVCVDPRGGEEAHCTGFSTLDRAEDFQAYATDGVPGDIRMTHGLPGHLSHWRLRAPRRGARGYVRAWSVRED
jgi:hypothetical protein